MKDALVWACFFGSGAVDLLILRALGAWNVRVTSIWDFAAILGFVAVFSYLNLAILVLCIMGIVSLWDSLKARRAGRENRSK